MVPLAESGIVPGGPEGMFESLRPQRGASQPTEEPGQPAPTHWTPRYLLELTFAVGAVVIAIAWLLVRAVSEPAGASFVSHVVQPFVLLGLVVFAARALVRQRLRWCRSCRRWKAMEWRRGGPAPPRGARGGALRGGISPPPASRGSRCRPCPFCCPGTPPPRLERSA